MKHFTVATFLWFFLFVGAAEGFQLVRNDGQPAVKWNSWLAKKTTKTKTPLPLGSVVLHRPADITQHCPVGSQACSIPGEIWLTTDPLWTPISKSMLAHEIGHQFDYTQMNNARRDEIRTILRTDEPWYMIPHEQFAEMWYAVFYYGSKPYLDATDPKHYHGHYDLMLTPGQYKRTRAIIRNVPLDAEHSMW